MLHIYTGDGKGKTTAAAGLSVRASSAGLRVLFAQFLKDETSAERKGLAALGVTVLGGFPFVGFLTDEGQKAAAKKNAEALFAAVNARADQFDLVVLDEVLAALSLGLIERDALLAFIEKMRDRELVLTGRDADKQLCGLADYVTEMKCLKHPYEKGLPAREGIEF